MAHRLQTALTDVLQQAPSGLRESLGHLVEHPDLIVNPVTRAEIPAAVLAQMRMAMGHALSGVFVVGLVVAGLAFLSAFLVPPGRARELAVDDASRDGRR